MNKNNFKISVNQLFKQIFSIFINKTSQINYLFQLLVDQKRMADRELVQKVFDFEFNCSQIKLEHDGFYQDDQQDNDKFKSWNLETTIKNLGLTQTNSYNLRWVGNEKSCFIEAFIYCLFKGSKSKLANKNGIFIKLKCIIYDMASKFLNLIDQKLISQMLCNVQYTEDLSIYFHQSKKELKLFKKLLNFFMSSMKFQSQQTLDSTLIQMFTKNFEFVMFTYIKQNVWQLQHFSQKFYIIIQKGCYFIVEVLQQQVRNTKSRKISQNNIIQQNKTNQKSKKLEYPAPKFILNNKISEKKKNPEQKSFSLTKRCSLQSYTRLQIYNQSNENNKSRSIQKQGQIQKRQKQFYANTNERGKTDVISSNKGTARVANYKSNNNLDSDQKEFNRANLKKIELNLKNLKLKNRTNTNSQNCSQNELIAYYNGDNFPDNEFSFNNG